MSTTDISPPTTCAFRTARLIGESPAASALIAAIEQALGDGPAWAASLGADGRRPPFGPLILATQAGGDAEWRLRLTHGTTRLELPTGTTDRGEVRAIIAAVSSWIAGTRPVPPSAEERALQEARLRAIVEVHRLYVEQNGCPMPDVEPDDPDLDAWYRRNFPHEP